MSRRDNNAYRTAFANRVRHEIQRAGFTYDEVAKRMRQHLPADSRLSTVSVWSYANGRSTPRKPAYLRALATVLGVEVEELLENPAGNGTDGSSGDSPAQTTMIQVADLDGERAYLHLQQEVHWTVALEILGLLKKDPHNVASSPAQRGSEIPEPDEIRFAQH